MSFPCDLLRPAAGPLLPARDKGSQPPPAGSPPPLRRRWAYLLAAAGGTLTYLAFPPVSAWPLAPAGVALLVTAAARQRARTAAGTGLVFGGVFFALLVRWLIGNIGILPWAALTAAEALLLAALTAPLPALLRLPGTPVVAALWWTATESIRSRFPLGGFPWGRLAFSQDDSPFLGWAGLAGAPAVTFVTALVAGALATCLLAPTTRRRLLGTGWLAAAVGLGLCVPLPAPTGGPNSAQIALVQGNVPRGRTLEEQARVRHVTRNHAEVTRKLARKVRTGRQPQPDLVIWPENSTDQDPRTDPYLRHLVTGAVDAVDSPVLIGAILDGPDGRTYNSGLWWRPGRGPGPSYAKRRLVPFGEYIPARELLGGLGDLQLIPRDFTPGNQTVVFTTGKIRTADVICYEIGYDAIVRSGVIAGANLLVEQTNDATFIRDGTTAEPEQQLAMARLRAVEHDRTVAVASTTGVSAVIRPDGSVARRSGTWEQALLTARVPLRSSLTLADRLGSLPEQAACAVTMLLWLVALCRKAISRRKVLTRQLKVPADGHDNHQRRRQQAVARTRCGAAAEAPVATCHTRPMSPKQLRRFVVLFHRSVATSEPPAADGHADRAHLAACPNNHPRKATR